MAPLRITKAHLADVVRQYALELRKMALSVGWPKLADLLAQVALEADSEVVPASRKPRKKPR